MEEHISYLCEQYLNIIYGNISPIYTPSNIAETSGEILFRSINKLIPIIDLTQNDSFIDLGSGQGKIVAQIFLTTNVRKSIGIEIVPALHHRAVVISERIYKELSHFYENARNLTFILGDFLKIPFNDVTVALINATCFPPSLIELLGEKINTISTIRLVLSLRPFFNLTKLSLKKIVSIECSWDTVLCYCYER